MAHEDVMYGMQICIDQQQETIKSLTAEIDRLTEKNKLLKQGIDRLLSWMRSDNEERVEDVLTWEAELERLNAHFDTAREVE